MGIAEQMGRTLQRTSISVNIKERLDFSCALFDHAGGLVANAPHLPVHLGAMQEAVRFQVLLDRLTWRVDSKAGERREGASGVHRKEASLFCVWVLTDVRLIDGCGS
jgi:hypothetical protein